MSVCPLNRVQDTHITSSGFTTVHVFMEFLLSPPALKPPQGSQTACGSTHSTPTYPSGWSHICFPLHLKCGLHSVIYQILQKSSVTVLLLSPGVFIFQFVLSDSYHRASFRNFLLYRSTPASLPLL